MPFDFQRRVLAHLENILELPAEQRRAYLDQACGDDQAMREAIETRLQGDWEALFPPRPIADEASTPLLEMGAQIGAYHIETILGQGGMGTVYLATHPYQKHVALKVLKRGMDTDFFLNRFHQERMILAELKHPNIATLLDAGATQEGRPFFVMEYVEGQSIRSFSKCKNLSIRDRLTLFLKVCSAVSNAHRHLVVHRDLKPGNILVNAQGDPKLLDFGIAKLLQAESGGQATLTAPYQRLMTPEYASPEQLRGHPISTASDIYSLGTLLYELLTGRRPFLEEYAQGLTLKQQILENTPIKPSDAVFLQDLLEDERPKHPNADEGYKTNPSPLSAKRWQRQLRGDLDTIILKALRKEPDRRYPSVDHFAQDLQNFLQGLPVSARRDTLAYRTGKFIRRNKMPLIACLVLSLLPITFATARFMERGQTLMERDRAERERNKWERTTKFLIEIFELSDPQKAKAASITARELLDNAARQLEKGCESQIISRAEFMTTIGRIYLNLGQLDSAQTILEDTLEIQKVHLPEEDPNYINTLCLLSEAYFQAANYQNALTTLGKVKTILTETGQDVGYSYSKTLLRLAETHAFQGDLQKAEILANEAMALRKEQLGPKCSEVAEALDILSAILEKQGRHQEASNLMLQSKSIRATI